MKKDESKEAIAKREAMLKDAFQKAIKGQLNGDKNHGWGAEDSLATAEELIAAEMPDGHVPSPALLTYLGLVINPSQFRQRLESQGLLNKAPAGAGRSKIDLAFLKS